MIVSDKTDCAKLKTSQNVQAKSECVGQGFTRQNPAPITQAGCAAAPAARNAQWVTTPARGGNEPACWVGTRSRANHLGNAGGAAEYVSGDKTKVTVGGNSAETMVMNFTIPADMANKGNCIVRLRYNMSTVDTKGLTAANNQDVLLADRNNREELSYQSVYGLAAEQAVGMAVNTNQNARTFQDRSFVFTVKPAPTANQLNGAGPGNGNPACAGKAIHNLNMRGKRGNIVQAYPSVEYDFVPSQINLASNECVHVQFAGSDYNPNRNPNNGEGGPSNPNNDNQAKSDRANVVAMKVEKSSYIAAEVRTNTVSGMPKPFDEDVATYKRFAMLDQQDCQTIQQLRQQIKGNGANKREQRERIHTNCGKLSAVKQPLTDFGLVKAGTTPGAYSFINTRNNNLSNRSQKGDLFIKGNRAATAYGVLPAEFATQAETTVKVFNNAARLVSGDEKNAPEESNTPFIVAAVGFGSLAAVGAAFVALNKVKGQSAVGNADEGAMVASTGKTVTARYAHNAKETGELSFTKGEAITVLRQDGSGWWEGENANGARGLFPSNYVQ